MYYAGVPKLWNETIRAHRDAVRDAILETAAALAQEHGLAAVKMSQIAEQAGIGRATLYKYFPDVEAILVAWHERHVAAHLARLEELRDQADGPQQRLEAVLGAYAMICYHRGRRAGTEIAALVHRGEPVARAQENLVELFRELLADAATAGLLRHDTDPSELARYCLYALGAAADLPDENAVQRLVMLTLDGLRAIGTAPVQIDASTHTTSPGHHVHHRPGGS